ncbi:MULTISPECIES: HNH endonuclease [unclassified Arthrobacter]|uniref:HNH endonuclease n=1 Tax=unclassified Arthrobacter TaxID=235627 RepID=UPI002E0A185E|nr:MULTISPECIES: HNH endonuclease [unclassified Arthrobacter]MEC5190247.1 5-methylcytosine-specific restriction protein A [Arthrobacter sp. MP_M4]MEC5202620.1 5-methylcytosine-specific restriction protein A [Arthrobacter sp. MP_M7]
MTAIILGWNPDHWNDWIYSDVRGRVAATGLYLQPWRVSHPVPAGTDAWLLLEGGHSRGLIGHGVVVSDVAQHDALQQPQSSPFPSVPGEAAPEQTRRVVLVAFDALLPAGEPIAVDVLQNAVPAIPWNGTEDFEFGVDPADEATIRILWRDFGPPAGPDPTLPAPGTYPQMALTRAAVNRYESDPDARRACIAHHGTSCAACGFSFEQKYGGLGADFVPVHHVVPVALLGSSYELDPLTDLVPLCANCHAMAHQGVGTPRTVAELRRIIEDAGYLRGSIVTPEQLEAQRRARELLGPQ